MTNSELLLSCLVGAKRFGGNAGKINAKFCLQDLKITDLHQTLTILYLQGHWGTFDVAGNLYLFDEVVA